MKIMVSGPIISWQIDGETMETMKEFIFLGSKITVDDECSHEIKTIATWKKNSITNLESIKKQRHYFSDKDPSSQNYGFSSRNVWMWELEHKESWMPKNWCFWTVVLEKILKSPLETLKRVPGKSNQSILREIIPEYSLKGMMLKLQYFDHLIWRTDSLEKTLMLGKIEGRRKTGLQKMG